MSARKASCSYFLTPVPGGSATYVGKPRNCLGPQTGRGPPNFGSLYWYTAKTTSPPYIVYFGLHTQQHALMTHVPQSLGCFLGVVGDSYRNKMDVGGNEWFVSYASVSNASAYTTVKYLSMQQNISQLNAPTAH